MRLATASCLLATASCAVAIKVVHDPGSRYQPQAAVVVPDLPLPTAPPPALEERQGQAAPGVVPVATINPDQYPSVTTGYFPSAIGNTVTYIAVVYTQTFIAVPDQWPSAGLGEIGYGTLAKTKRDAIPEPTPDPTGIADLAGIDEAIVMELHTVFVTQPVHLVTEVIVLQTLTISGNTTLNDTLARATPTGSSSGFHQQVHISASLIAFHRQSSSGY